MKGWLFLVALCGTVVIASAGTITWTNTAGGQWNKTNNWSPNQIPGGADSSNPDDVVIAAPGTYNVTFNAATPCYVHSLTLGAGTGNGVQTLSLLNKTVYAGHLTVTGGGVFVDNNSIFHAPVNVQNGGVILSTNSIYYVTPLTISNGGSMSANAYYSSGETFHGDVIVGNGGSLSASSTYTAASIASDATLNVSPGGTVNLSPESLYLYGPMTNAGTVAMAQGMISINNDGLMKHGYLLNQPGGRISLNNSYINGSGAGSTVVNQGAIVCTGNSGGIFVTNFDTALGTVTNQASGSYLSLGYFSNVLSGTFNAANGATIRLYGGTSVAPLTPGDPLSLSGGGIIQFYSGWLSYPSNIVPHLDLYGGVLTVGPKFQGGAITNLQLDGITFTNKYGFAVTGVFSSTNSILYGSYIVENGGVWNGAREVVYGPVTVSSGGTFNIHLDLVMIKSPMLVQANGQVNVLDGFLTVYAPLTNYGTINVTTSINIDNYPGLTAGDLVNQDVGVINLLSSGSIVADVSFGFGHLINNGSIVKSDNPAGSYIEMQPGRFTNAGSITVLGGALNLYYIELLPTSSLNVRLHSKVDYGTMHIIAANLSGTFNVTTDQGYSPAVSDSFSPLTTQVLGGDFTTMNLPPLSPLLRWQSSFGWDGTLSLVVTQPDLIPQFSSAAWSGSNLIFSGTNGTPGKGFAVLSSTNLSVPLTNWTLFMTNSFGTNGDFHFTTTPNPAAPGQFFILKQ